MSVSDESWWGALFAVLIDLCGFLSLESTLALAFGVDCGRERTRVGRRENHLEDIRLINRIKLTPHI